MHWPLVLHFLDLFGFDWLRNDLNASHNPSSLIFLLTMTPFSYFFNSYFNSWFYTTWCSSFDFRTEILHFPQSPWTTLLSQGLIGMGMMTFTRQNETDHQTIFFLPTWWTRKIVIMMMMIHLHLWDLTSLEVLDRSRRNSDGTCIMWVSGDV